MRITPALLVIGLAVSGVLAPATLFDGASSGGAAAATPPGTIQLAVIAPVTVPPTSGGMLDPVELDEYTTPGGLLAVQLGHLSGRDVTMAIDPMILASIRSLGTSAPESATSWLTRLAEGRNESFALEWSDANPVLSLQAGREVLSAPVVPVDPTLFSPEGSDPVEAEPGEPVVPELPSQDDLVAWAHSLGKIAMPADHSLNSSDIEGLDAAGFDAVVVNSGSVTTTTIKSPHVALGSIDGIVTNDVVSSLLRATVAAPTDEAWALSFDGLSSALAIHSEIGGDVVLAAALGRIDASSPYRVSQTLSALANLDWLELVPVSAVLDQPAVSTTISSEDVVDPRAATIDKVLSAQEDLLAFSTVLDNPLPIVSSRREQVLSLLSTGWDPTSPAWQAVAEQFLSDCRDITGAVTIPDSSLVNLLADNGQFPVTVRNALAHAVTVYVTVRPDRPIVRFLESRVKVSVAANSQAKAMIPVQTVANGRVSATVSLSSSDRTRISTPVRIGMNVQAGWETTATIVVVALVGLMLFAGIWRTVRARRRTVASREASLSGEPSGSELSNSTSANDRSGT